MADGSGYAGDYGQKERSETFACVERWNHKKMGARPETYGDSESGTVPEWGADQDGVLVSEPHALSFYLSNSMY